MVYTAISQDQGDLPQSSRLRDIYVCWNMGSISLMLIYLINGDDQRRALSKNINTYLTPAEDMLLSVFFLSLSYFYVHIEGIRFYLLTYKITYDLFNIL